jgi:hypothetical protein
MLPGGSEVKNIYKDGDEIKVDVNVGGSDMTCSLKKNHAGELYIE